MPGQRVVLAGSLDARSPAALRLTYSLINKVVKRVADDRLSVIFGALADPTRRAILARLADSEATVTELTAPFPISMPAISRHLKVLERAGLISRSRSGQRLSSTLRPAALQEATEWMERYRQFWDASLDRLDTHLRRAAPGREGH
jgi:DNA-binding transcriptional ArsR family regulator